MRPPPEDFLYKSAARGVCLGKSIDEKAFDLGRTVRICRELVDLFAVLRWAIGLGHVQTPGNGTTAQTVHDVERAAGQN